MDSSDTHGAPHPATITTLAERVFGDAEAARQWLRASNAALEQRTPLSMLHTEGGTRTVEAILLRIEHGVYE